MTKNVFDVRRSCASRGTVDPARAPPSITAVYSTSHSTAADEVCRTAAASLASRLHVVARVAASEGEEPPPPLRIYSDGGDGVSPLGRTAATSGLDAFSVAETIQAPRVFLMAMKPDLRR